MGLQCRLRYPWKTMKLSKLSAAAMTRPSDRAIHLRYRSGWTTWLPSTHSAAVLARSCPTAARSASSGNPGTAAAASSTPTARTDAPCKAFPADPLKSPQIPEFLSLSLWLLPMCAGAFVLSLVLRPGLLSAGELVPGCEAVGDPLEGTQPDWFGSREKAAACRASAAGRRNGCAQLIRPTPAPKSTESWISSALLYLPLTEVPCCTLRTEK